MAGLPALNGVDIAALVYVALSILIGYHRGLSGELSRLLGAAAAFVVGLLLYQPFGEWIVQNTRLTARTGRAAAFLATILATWLILLVIRLVLKRIMKVGFEETTDKAGGAVAGFLASAVTVVIVFLVMNLWPQPYLNRKFGEESAFGHLALKVLPALREKAEEIPAARKVVDKIEDTGERVNRATESHRAGR